MLSFTNCECCLHHFITIQYCSKIMSPSLTFYQACSIWADQITCSSLHKIEHFCALYRLYLKVITIKHRTRKWLNLHKLPEVNCSINSNSIHLMDAKVKQWLSQWMEVLGTKVCGNATYNTVTIKVVTMVVRFYARCS